MSISLSTRGIRVLLRRFCENRLGVIGLIIIFSSITIGLIGQMFSPYDPKTVGVGPPLHPPSRRFIFGTDNLGRDIFSGVLTGISISFAIGITSACTAAIFGIPIGAIAGYFRKIDPLLLKLIEMFQVIPMFFLAILVVAFFGTHISNIIIVIAILAWSPIARVTRGEVLSEKEEDYVTAAKSCGYSKANILFDEVLPNAIPPVVSTVTIQIAMAMLLESVLSFLGFGDPNFMSLGYMLHNANEVLQFAWWPTVLPGAILTINIWAVRVVGDALNIVFFPRLGRPSIIHREVVSRV